jgi:hypothetical protein
LRQLGARRHALAARSDALRARLLDHAAQAHRSLGAAQLAGAAVRRVGRHPGALTAVAAALVLIGPRRGLRIAAGVLGAWSLFRRVSVLAALVGRLARRG